jgi:hypothetical protein
MIEDFPELDPLLRALTADPAPAELTGEESAVAMFRAQRAVPRTAGRKRRFVPSMGMAAAAAMVVAAALTGGAYAAVLPTPIQHIAHRVLARIGVPDARHSPSSAGASSTGPSSTGPSSTGPSRLAAANPAAARTSGSFPSVTRTAAAVQNPLPVPPIVLSAVRTEVAAGSSVTLDGRLAPGGAPMADARVQLLELDGSRWRPVGAALTDGDGEATFTVRHVTRNTEFRLASRVVTTHTALSPPILVTVLPWLTVVISDGGPAGSDVITVTARSADPGDMVILQVATGTAWHDFTELRLNAAHQASFTVVVAAGQNYRVVLPATRTHAGAVSAPVQVPRGNRESATSHHRP